MINLYTYSDCFDFSNTVVRRITCSEKQSKYVLTNNSNYNICKIKIDACVLRDSDGRKCDYLVRAIKEQSKHLFLIELKGRDVLKAVSQINESLNKLKITNSSGFKVHGRIVPTSTYGPNLRTTQYLNLKNRFRSLNGTLECKTKNSDTI